MPGRPRLRRRPCSPGTTPAPTQRPSFVHAAAAHPLPASSPSRRARPWACPTRPPGAGSSRRPVCSPARRCSCTAQAAASASRRSRWRRTHGAIVIGTAGTERGLELVRSEGAHLAVRPLHDRLPRRHRSRSPAGAASTSCSRCSPTSTSSAILGMLAPRGRIVVIGSRGSLRVQPAPHDGEGRLDHGHGAVERHGAEDAVGARRRGRGPGDRHAASCRRPRTAPGRGRRGRTRTCSPLARTARSSWCRDHRGGLPRGTARAAASGFAGCGRGLLAAWSSCCRSLLGTPLLDPDEGLHAAIAQEMVERGDWVTPRLLGAAVPRQARPVLLEPRRPRSPPSGRTSSRSSCQVLPSACSARWAPGCSPSGLFGRATGLTALVFYATLLLPFGLAQAAVHDVALVPWTTLAMLSLWDAASAPAWRSARSRGALAGLWLGLAVLTKALTGVALVGLPFVVWAVGRDASSLRLVAAGVLSLIVAAHGGRAVVRRDGGRQPGLPALLLRRAAPARLRDDDATARAAGVVVLPADSRRGRAAVGRVPALRARRALTPDARETGDPVAEGSRERRPPLAWILAGRRPRLPQPGRVEAADLPASCLPGRRRPGGGAWCMGCADEATASVGPAGARCTSGVLPLAVVLPLPAPRCGNASRSTSVRSAWTAAIVACSPGWPLSRWAC